MRPQGGWVKLAVGYGTATGHLKPWAVRYIRENDELKASEIHYQYWESEEEFPAEAKCPEDFELGFLAA